MKNVILVSSHIPFSLYASELYIPIQAGATSKPSFGIIRDDEGDNISSMNPYYSELTTLYWGWKHYECEYLGIVHYRRFFIGSLKASINDKTTNIISEEECSDILKKYDLIVPKKRHYIIESLYKHYCRTLRPEPLIKLGEVIKKNYPEYIYEFERLKKRRSAHIFNMMIAKKEFLDKYLPWLFDILDKAYHKLDMHDWTDYEKRGLSSAAELLLDIYISHNHVKFKEQKYTELIPFVLIRKGFNYLLAKFFGKKYKKSIK